MNFKKALDNVYDKNYTITDKGRIKQNEQFELKNELTDALMKDLEENDIQVFRVQKGFVILVENEMEGAIPIELQIITKPLDYDYEGLHDEYLAKLKKD